MANELSRDAKFKYGSTTVGDITQFSWAVDGNTIETNSFDAGAFTEAMLGRRTVTISLSGNIDREDTDGQNALRTDYLDSSKSQASDFDDFAVEPENPASGDTTFSGSGFPTNYTEDRGDDGDGLATYSAEIRISGTWTEATAT